MKKEIKQEHKTNGSKCWCNPRVIKVFPKTLKKRKCVHCLRSEPKGGWISVNVYDPIIGHNMGVECGRKDCKVLKGSPSWIKNYWFCHFLQVVLSPDWFADYVYEDFFKKIIDNVQLSQKLKERIIKLKQYLRRKWKRK